MDASDHGQIWDTTPEGLNKTTEHIGLLVTRPKLEPGTSRMHSKSVTVWATLLGTINGKFVQNISSFILVLDFRFIVLFT
jgi:hypothetical protein